jgi:chitodextrinase
VKDVTPKEDPTTPGLGVVEVNHPGGACWQGVTPDIRPGDVVRITNQVTGAVDTSTVRNVTASRPVQTAPDTVQIHGTARDANGDPLPIAELEQRLVAPNDAFLKNGRRTLRATSAAGSDGTLSYDGAGSVNWTATYTNLLPADVTRALNAESRGMWIDPALPSTESTIFENGAAAVAGPSAPCTAPLEKLPPPAGSETAPPSDPSGLTATVSNSTVTLEWTGSTDNVGVTDYGVYRDGVAIGTVQNPDGSAGPPKTFVDNNLAPGTYTYTVDAGDAVGNRSGLSNSASATTSVNPAGLATNDPPVAPHSLIGFPARDFISATGYTPGASYRFSVIRGGNIIATSTPVVADSTGLAEVNHPGGACWEGVTPNIKPGDAIRITGPGGVSEQTTIAGVTAERPVVTSDDPVTGGGTIEIHGTAQDADGNPLPLDQIEERLIAPKDAFDLNGRRSIRAGAGLDGTLAYNAAGSTHWTATYTLQTPNDLARGRRPVDERHAVRRRRVADPLARP